MWRETKGTKGVITRDLDELMVRVRIGLHTFLYAFTWDRPEDELRPAWLRVGRRPDTSYFRTSLRLYRSHVKRKRISDRVHK